MSRICYLKCVKNAQKRINLPHGAPVLIGRNEETGITDLHVSRSHLECTADLDSSKVLVKTLGKSYSGCNGYALMRNETYALQHGDRIDVRLGFHEYEIVFEEPDVPTKKPKLDFFSVSSTSSGLSGQWEEIDGKDLLIYTSDNCEPRAAIAAFDLDGTLIKTKSGARFPKDRDDWTLNINSIPQKLKHLHENDHKVVVFSNQMGIGNNHVKIGDFKQKIEAINSKLSVPMQFFIATGKSIYRKPAPGMWNVLSDIKNTVAIDKEKSFYVGDAAGREKNWTPKKNKDHSCGDRLFAINLGLKFYTPEEYFLKSSKNPFVMPEFDPRVVSPDSYPEISEDKPQVIVMVGGPASGKSHYCKNQLKPQGFMHVSRDELGSWEKCVKQLEAHLKNGQKVVIDNTNPDKSSRLRYIEVAKKYNVPCRCFVMSTTLKQAKHNNRFRELTDKNHKIIGDVVLNSYKNAFQEPDSSEGFSDISKVPFIPKFSEPEHQKLYRMYLLEN